MEDRTGNKKSYSESELPALGFNTQLTVSSEGSGTLPTLIYSDSFNGLLDGGWQAGFIT